MLHNLISSLSIFSLPIGIIQVISKERNNWSSIKQSSNVTAKKKRRKIPEEGSNNGNGTSISTIPLPGHRRFKNESRDLSSASDWMAPPEALHEAVKKKEGTVRTHVPLFRLIQGRGGTRHLISEIPNIFKSTEVRARARACERTYYPSSFSISLSLRPRERAGRKAGRERALERSLTRRLQRRRCLSAAIKIRIIIISATAEWSVCSRTKRSSVSAMASPRRSNIPLPPQLSALLSLSFFLLFWRPLIPFLLPAATTLPSAERYPARSPSSWIYGWLPRRSHIVICRVVFTNGRRKAKVPRLYEGVRVALSERTQVRALLETRGCVFTRASLCAPGVLKRWNVRATVNVDGFKCIRF